MPELKRSLPLPGQGGVLGLKGLRPMDPDDRAIPY
jgi:hypothetical protein